MWRVSACLFLCCLQAGAAWAEGRVGLVNLRFVDVPTEEREAWLGALQHEAEARGLQVISEANLRYVQSTSSDLFACAVEDRCRTEIGRRLGADLILTGQISRANNEWLANLTLHAVDLGTAVKSQVVHCPGCTPATFQERLTETVSDLVSADRATARATLIVRTLPPGAAIAVDGRPVGTAECEVTVVAGAHRLEATHDNHDPLKIDVELRAQERLEVDLKLPPRSLLPPSALAAKARRDWWTTRRIAAVAMMAAGGVGVIIGIPLVAIDGSVSWERAHRYGTSAAGGALLGIGAAVAVIGGVVLLTSRGPTPTRAVLAPSVGSSSVGLTGAVEF